MREYLRRSSQDDDPLLVLRDSQEFSMRETPDQIRSELKVSGRNSSKAMHKAWLSIREILDYRRLHPKVSGRDAAFLGTQLHARLAAPWTCFIVVLITIPFGAMPGRRNLFYGVAGSIGIAFCFFVLQRLGFALGQKGTLDPWIAAWLPNLFFGFFGIGMILRLP